MQKLKNFLNYHDKNYIKNITRINHFNRILCKDFQIFSTWEGGWCKQIR